MKNMDKELKVPKWVQINHSKIPQVPKICVPRLFDQAQKFGISVKKGVCVIPAITSYYLMKKMVLTPWVCC